MTRRSCLACPSELLGVDQTETMQPSGVACGQYSLPQA